MYSCLVLVASVKAFTPLPGTRVYIFELWLHGRCTSLYYFVCIFYVCTCCCCYVVTKKLPGNYSLAASSHHPFLFSLMMGDQHMYSQCNNTHKPGNIKRHTTAMTGVVKRGRVYKPQKYHADPWNPLGSHHKHTRQTYSAARYNLRR